MKVSDFIAEFLKNQGVRHAFGITGGAIVHVFDSIDRAEGIRYICPAHEQAAAMAADAYARITGNLGVAIATSGPGATNLVTGVACSYFDSIPVLVITGQVPRSQLRNATGCRQVGFQETDVAELFRSITKYSALVADPERVRYEFERAVYLARSGRPGPVVLDLPDDVQRAQIDPAAGAGFEPPAEPPAPVFDSEIAEIRRLLAAAERPVLILGGGIRLCGAERLAVQLAEHIGVPFALTWAARDFVPGDHPLVIESFGVSAERPGNFAVQNADLIIALGTRLDTHETGSNLATFARGAKKVVVDIDPTELAKYPERGLRADLLIEADVGALLAALWSARLPRKEIPGWLAAIRRWRERYPICPPEYFDQSGAVNAYAFMTALSQESRPGDIIVTDTGANLTWTMQALHMKQSQRLFSAFNHSPMGYALPAAMGACFGSGAPVICITGDGGIQMNIQELATISYHRLPVKVFLMNNRGYGMIEQTQDMWLDSRYAASTPEGGVAMPDFVRIAEAYDIRAVTIHDHADLRAGIRATLDFTDGPILCNVEIDPRSRIVPKLEFGRPIEDSSPLLERAELSDNMLIPPPEK